VRLADITIRGTLAVPTEGELDDAERALGTRMPLGYREFMLTCGEGVLGGAYIRVYPPWRIRRELTAWRRRITEYWLWDGLPQQRGVESVVVGDTLDGDELIFHPSNPDAIWVLPHDSDQASQIGAGIWEALEWLCSSGVLTEAFAERDFEPSDSRKSEGAA
jgi:hypothetical protein